VDRLDISIGLSW